MSRSRQFAVVAAVAGTLLLATSNAAPQPFSPARVAAIAARNEAADRSAAERSFASRPAEPDVCFANRPCPAPRASICFASAVVREPACPAPKVTYRFAQAPAGEKR